MDRLAEKVIVITGAGSGLGRESALLFAEQGAHVVGADINEDRLEKTVADMAASGYEMAMQPCDITSEDQVELLLARTLSQFGHVDGFFANAGIIVEGAGSVPFEELSAEAWNAVIAVNLTGTFFCCKHAAKAMKARGSGSILVTSSAAGLRSYPGIAAYTASKGGVNALVMALSFDLGRYGIRVNAIAPTHGMSVNFVLPSEVEPAGRTYEDMAGPWDPARSPMPLKLGRAPRLRDNANAALFFMSDDSIYISGVCLPTTDGGHLNVIAQEFAHDWVEDVTEKAT